MKKFLKNLIKDEKGYGTIELLILVAAIGILATALMSSLKDTLTGEGGSVESVGTGIEEIISNWAPEGE